MSDYKRPESVLVLVYTAAGEVLLLERREPPGFWQSVTGSLEWGESATAAALRELREETGLDAGPALRDCRMQSRFPILPAWRARYAPDVAENLEHVYAVCYSSLPPVRLDPAEHRRCHWLPAVEAAAQAGSVTNREAIRRLLPGRSGVESPSSLLRRRR
ncbi:dihydroneopterin triphosphate diphosphatase [Thiohalobacter thiocyanaticus]|uniref:Dihydroneopterin triphosphate diphosphatase n=1 Tax=Thiohalobacter thiocyanaticus TaxID=585455 RepID=A0A426QHE7_9GAMM|nr:dihydroneopterin triphosphate diphosphatase [Thiohalobacter thiocyanaticus]RRQ21177.1 dihydroneopterin triphosphate diphosphatase [Thiohalobacter thiocyanaticus]